MASCAADKAPEQKEEDNSALITEFVKKLKTEMFKVCQPIMDNFETTSCTAPSMKFKWDNKAANETFDKLKAAVGTVLDKKLKNTSFRSVVGIEFCEPANRKVAQVSKFGKNDICALQAIKGDHVAVYLSVVIMGKQ